MRLIRTFPDGSVLEFDRGKFDDWCLYLTRPTIPRYPPLDVEYFAQLKSLAARHSTRAVYEDFVTIFNRTNEHISPHVLEMIFHMSHTYGPDALEIDILLTILYGGMVAEMNKRSTKLKKRVKRLGIHQLLLEDYSPEDAGSFSRGKGWEIIDMECCIRGF
jgi:hypothetical protein